MWDDFLLFGKLYLFGNIIDMVESDVVGVYDFICKFEYEFFLC